MERHQRIQLKKTSRSINQPVSVSSFQTRGFGVQQKAASTLASKAELWENYQRSSQITQQGAGQTRSAIQTKLSIGQPGDKYEQEADSVADRVMAMSEPAQVQREELGEEEEELQMKPLAGMISPLVQREELPEEEEELQMKPENRAIQREELPEEEEELQMKSLDNSIQREALPEEEEELQMKESPNPNSQLPTDSLEDRLSSSKGGGSPLSDDVRSFMEPRFGADFSGVRVHTGSDAVQMNQDVSAQAFAHGSDVYFGAGKAPGKDALTAHELTHVVQQTGQIQTLIQRDISTPLPQGTPVQRDGSASIQVAQVRTQILPDKRTTDRKMTGKAKTAFKFGLIRTPRYTFGKDGKITSIKPMPPVTMTIQTTYGPTVTAQSSSAYGRGTTQADVQAGNTSLGFHEGNHGLDYMDYLTANALPVFAGAVGMTVQEYSLAAQKFQKDMQEYVKNMDDYSDQHTDCVGTNADTCPSP
jgi:Domain of unknown function (DUF4157)